MIKKQFIIFLFLLLNTTSFIQAEGKCYLVVEKSGDYNSNAISDFAIPLISKYIEPVQRTGYGGIRAQDCQYKLSLSENKNGINIVIAGQKIVSFGDTGRSGIKGVKEALLRAVYRGIPEKKQSICRLYSSIIPEDCGLKVKKASNKEERYQLPGIPGINDNPLRQFEQQKPTWQSEKPNWNQQKETAANKNYEVLSIRFFEGGKTAPDAKNRVYKNRFSRNYSRYIFTEFKINNLQYRGKDHKHDMIWFYYNPNGSLRGRITGTFNVKSKWSTAWIYRGWGWNSYGNWPRGTYTVKVIVDGILTGTRQFTIY